MNPYLEALKPLRLPGGFYQVLDELMFCCRPQEIRLEPVEEEVLESKSVSPP